MSCCTCGCCDGVHAVTPADDVQPAPARRDHLPHRDIRCVPRIHASPAVGLRGTACTHDTRFRRPEHRPARLFAVIADILTFYQERIANEGYLRTATEPDSLAELAQLVGYRARPALGATTYLAYALDPDAKTLIPAGSGAKSVARQNELPQTFETSDDLQAREEWDNLQPAMTSPPAITYYGPPKGDSGYPDDVNEFAALNITGTTANLKAGDRRCSSSTPNPRRLPGVQTRAGAPRCGSSTWRSQTSPPIPPPSRWYGNGPRSPMRLQRWRIRSATPSMRPRACPRASRLPSCLPTIWRS